MSNKNQNDWTVADDYNFAKLQNEEVLNISQTLQPRDDFDLNYLDKLIKNKAKVRNLFKNRVRI
jgi:hypothetical protein